MKRKLIYWMVAAPRDYCWKGRRLVLGHPLLRGVKSHRYFHSKRRATNVFNTCPEGAWLVRSVYINGHRKYTDVIKGGD